MKCDIGHIALSFITDNLKIHALPIAMQSTEFITRFNYIYIKTDNKKKERNRVDKYRSKYKEKIRGFRGYASELLPLNLNRCTCKMARNQTYP